MRTLQEFRFQVRVRRCSVYSRRPHLCRYHGWAKCKQWYLLVVLNLNFCPGCWFTCGRYLRAYFLWDTCWSVTPKGEEKPFANIAFKTASHNAESIQQTSTTFPPNAQLLADKQRSTSSKTSELFLQQKGTKPDDEGHMSRDLENEFETGSMNRINLDPTIKINYVNHSPNNWQTYWQNGPFTGETLEHKLLNIVQCDGPHSKFTKSVCGLPLQFSRFSSVMSNRSGHLVDQNHDHEGSTGEMHDREKSLSKVPMRTKRLNASGESMAKNSVKRAEENPRQNLRRFSASWTRSFFFFYTKQTLSSSPNRVMISIGKHDKANPHLERKTNGIAERGRPLSERGKHQHYWCKLVCTKSFVGEKRWKCYWKSEGTFKICFGCNIWRTWAYLSIFFEKTTSRHRLSGLKSFSLDFLMEYFLFCWRKLDWRSAYSGRGKTQRTIPASDIHVARFKNRRNRSSNNHQPNM